MSRSSLKVSLSYMYATSRQDQVKKQSEVQQQLENVWLIKFLAHCFEYDYDTHFLVSLGIVNNLVECYMYNHLQF